MLRTIIVGAGFASQTHWIPTLTESAGFRIEGVVDLNAERLDEIKEATQGAWTALSIDDIPVNVPRDTLVFVVTPDHFSVVSELAEVGFSNFVIEKPLVSRDAELRMFMDLWEKRRLRVYALDHYLQKTYALQLILGIVSVDDPRNAMLEVSGDHGIDELSGCLGKIEGVSYTNMEAGKLAIPYLDEHPWLEHDPVIGGNIRDLGPHAFAPLVACGLLWRDSEIWDVKLSRFTPDRESLQPVATQDDIEMYISTLFAHGDISLSVQFGKIPIEGGDRSISVKGENGYYFLALPRNGSAIVMTNDGKVSKVSLKCSTNEFAVEEIRLFFEGELSEDFDGHLETAFVTLETGVRVREAYHATITG